MEQAVKALWRLSVGAVFVYLALPTVVVLLTSFSSAATLTFPPTGLSLRWYGAVFDDPYWRGSLLLSIGICAIVTPLCLLIAVPSAYALVRYRFPGRDIMAMLLMSPLMLPEVVLGIALLYYFVHVGLVNTPLGLILGHTLVALPYALRAIMVSAAALDPNVEKAGAVLGAGFWRIFRDLVLPALRPGMLAAAVFTSITSLGEAGVSVFVAGAQTTTVPVRVFASVEYSISPLLTAVSSLFIFAAIPLLVLLERYVGLSKIV